MVAEVNNYSLSPRRFIGGTKGSFGTETLDFIFSDEWEGLTKTVTFYPPDGDAVSVIYNDSPIVLPSELSAQAGLAEFTVRGTKAGAVLFSVKGYIDILDTHNTTGDDPITPTPSQTEQLLEMMTTAVDTAQSVRNDADNGVFNGADGADGVKGDKGDKGDTGAAATVVQVTGTGEDDVMSQKAVTDALDGKLSIDGYSALAAVGTADNLAGKGDAVGAMFTRRTSGGSADIADGTATIERLRGNTVIGDGGVGLISFVGTGITTVGFNQWDEEWEPGAIAASNGADVVRSTNIRSKNYIPVFPDTVYYFRTRTNVGKFLRFYDENKTYLGEATIIEGNTNATFTTPAGAYFMRFYTDTSYGTVYKGDICVNISWSGIRNGEYEAYVTQTRTFGDMTDFDVTVGDITIGGMKSAGAIYDERVKDKDIRRVGVIDLGALTYEAVNGIFRTTTAINDAAAINNIAFNGLCEKYLPISWAEMNGTQNNRIAVGTDKILRIVDTSHADAASLKASLNGVYLFYELETPVETVISRELNLKYQVSDFGTEEIVVPEGALSSPARYDVVYGLNAVDTIRRLPVGYISKRSFDNFTEALGEATGITVTSEYDEDAGEYVFTVTQNGGI